MTNLTIYTNNSIEDEPLGSSAVLYTAVIPGSDYLVFTKGSPIVADGQPIPSSFQFGSAGVVLNGTEQIISDYLLADVSSNLLRQIYNMGNGNYRYVLAFSFDGATTSEPILEFWDDTSLSTTNFVSLGAGTPNNSWFHGITTTSGAPGANWTGLPLAGSANGNFLWLNNNNGPLVMATVLYCNLQVIVPASQVNGGAELPIMVVKYTTT